MEKMCAVSLVGDVSTAPNLENWLSQAAAELKALLLFNGGVSPMLHPMIFEY